MTDSLFLERMRILKRAGLAVTAGFASLVVAVAVPEGIPQNIFIFLALLLVIPSMLYLILVIMWHWKGRYRGTHSDLWAGLLVFETSGVFKVVYFFRHVLPDAYGTGRYRRLPVEHAA